MSEHHVKSDEEAAVERKWRERLMQAATSQEFEQAYDELHSLFLQEQESGPSGRRGLATSTEPQIYGKVNPRGMDRARQAILRKIGRGHRVLEVGCGDGATSRLLASQGNAVVSVDISHVALEVARRQVQGESLDLKYQYGDARKLESEGDEFDFVVSEHFVEHLSVPDMLIHLEEMRRVLKLGGCYLISTPSRLWNGRRSVGFHLHVYTLEELCQVVAQSGLEATWLEPRFLRRFGFIVERKASELRPVFLWEHLLHAIHIFKWPAAIRSRVLPSVMVGATKRD